MIAIADYWKTFVCVAADESISSQFRCHTGCQALHFTLQNCWKTELLTEWAELMTLAHAALEDRQTIAILAATTQGQLSHEQWVRKLEIFIELRSPERYQPSFSDVAVLCGLGQYSRMNDSHYVEWIRALIELEEIHASCSPSSPNFSEVVAQRGLTLLDQTRLQGQKFSPFFALPKTHTPIQLRAA